MSSVSKWALVLLPSILFISLTGHYTDIQHKSGSESYTLATYISSEFHPIEYRQLLSLHDTYYQYCQHTTLEIRQLRVDCLRTYSLLQRRLKTTPLNDLDHPVRPMALRSTTYQ